MKKRLGVVSVVTVLVMALFALSALAWDAEMYFSSDKNGAIGVTNIQEGDSVWIAVFDPDENTDCDVRDKIWTDIKVMDPKTGAYIVWISYQVDDPVVAGVAPFNVYYDDPFYIPFQGHFPGDAGSYDYDYLEETGPDTGLFVSSRAFQVGTRENFAQPVLNTHVVDANVHPNTNGGTNGVPLIAGQIWLQDFQWGGYEYLGGIRDYLDGSPAPSLLLTMPWANLLNPVFPAGRTGVAAAGDYLVGRFENNNSLLGMYVDQNDPTDVAIAMAKIKDTEATISWSEEVFKDANGSATITVVDPDENLNCNIAEWVPVFIIINPGSWNPTDYVAIPAPLGGINPTNFCMLKATGGVDPTATAGVGAALPLINAGAGQQISWWNIYNSGLAAMTPADVNNAQDLDAGTYYIEYPTTIDIVPNVVTFDTVEASGACQVMFWAQETGVSTGIFQLNLNDLLADLGFNSLNVRDVLVAYYLDPNDEDDFKLATAYIEERRHSITSFTDATRTAQDLFWLGRDAVYLEVIDANANVDSCCPEQVVVHVCDPHEEDDVEYFLLDETSSNSPVFFSNAGAQLWPSWDALGIGWWGFGFQIVNDNWKIEAYNEDSIYARYNDVYYVTGVTGLGGLGDLNAVSTTFTAFPPEIRATRVANDLSFDVMEIASTEVYDGTGDAQMWFLNRQGNRVFDYVNSDCVFVEVLDPDQDEDQYRRERIDAYWDGFAGNLGQNYPFGPVGLLAAPWLGVHPIIPGAVPVASLVNNLLGVNNPWDVGGLETHPQLYVLNPRTGNWAAIDLLETGVATGDFVSTICIDLSSQYVGVPTLGVNPGDTIIAVYKDPSNHSDSAWIQIKVGVGGGTTPPSQMSTTTFVDAAGNEVANYTDADMAYVRVVDASHAGQASIAGAVEIDGVTYDLMLDADATFMTAGIDLGAAAGASVTATYTDPTDPTDTSFDTITIIASELVVDRFYAGPNPFDTEVTFGFTGSGVAELMTVKIYDLTGGLLRELTGTDVTELVWDGTDEAGSMLANGAYIYVITATDGTDPVTDKGTVFINR